ncbi:MAG: hypothetical protein MJ072_02430, partial [Clostridia bacterium]|nr:hypothetical protein [Clostridia bacterium]
LIDNVAEPKKTKYNQDVRFMRAPVVSALGEKLGITEQELCAVIDYVDEILDGNTPDSEPTFTSTTGYSNDEVIFAVQEARSMVYDLGRHHNIVMPKNPRRSEAVTETAKDFLKFFASDFASRIYVEALEGLNLPFGYEVEDTSRFSSFVQSMYSSYPAPVPVSYYKTTPLTFAGNIYITPNYKLETTIFGSTMAYEALGLKMYNDTVTRYTVDRDWNEILRISGLTE